MATLHQAHNLPWTCITDHITYTSRSYTPEPFAKLIMGPTKHLPPAKQLELRERIKKDIFHFSKVFQDTVRMFAETERQKLDRLAAEKTHIDTADDFSLQWEVRPDLASHSDLHKDVTYECSLPPTHPLYSEPGPNPYARLWSFKAWRSVKSTYDMDHMFGWDAGEVIKHLINLDTEESLLTLRRLARESKTGVRMAKSHALMHHGSGWGGMSTSTMDTYLFLNLMVANDMHTKGMQWLMGLPGMEWFYREMICRADQDEHKVGERVFFEKWKADVDTMDILKEHLKTLFRRMYIYDSLSREVGEEEDWVETVNYSLQSYYGLPYLTKGKRYVNWYPRCFRRWRGGDGVEFIEDTEGPCEKKCELHSARAKEPGRTIAVAVKIVKISP